MKHFISRSVRRNLGRTVRVMQRIKGHDEIRRLRGESRLRSGLEQAVGAWLRVPCDKTTSIRRGLRSKLLDIHHDNLIVFERIGPAVGNKAAMKRLVELMG